MTSAITRTARAAAVLALLLSSLNLLAANPPEPPRESVNAINATELKMHLEFLASDELGGRHTLAPNFAVASRYLASRLGAYGFRGAGDNGSFLQTFDVISGKTDAEKTTLRLTIGKETVQYAYGDFFTREAGNSQVQGAIVFAGYGISAPRLNHDDYAGLDVKGKIVLIAPGAPDGIDSSKLEDSEHGEGAAKTHGAAGVINLPPAFMAAGLKRPGFKERFANRELVRLAKSASDGPPAITLALEPAEKLLALLGLTLDHVYAAGKNGAPLHPKTLVASVEFTISVNQKVIQTRNVVGVLEGTDPKLRDQYVAFSAHYDHLGTGPMGEIFNGADDDGSGTSAVLAIARAMSANPPRRSVFIIFHAGEELGLLGSEYNTDIAPAVPLNKLVVDLNIDMIGRSRPANDTNKADEHLTDANSVYLVGDDRISKQLHTISEATNSQYEKLHFDYTYNDPNNPERIYYRSDHWNYAKHGVPIIFYFTGVHADYHQPTDTVDKIDFEKMTRVTRLVYETGWRIANQDDPLKKD